MEDKKKNEELLEESEKLNLSENFDKDESDELFTEEEKNQISEEAKKAAAERIKKIREKEIIKKEKNAIKTEHKKEKMSSFISFLKRGQNLRILAIVLAVVLVVVAIVCAVKFIPKSVKKSNENKGKVITVSAARLEEILEISELDTVSYNYNSIVDVKGKSKNKITKKEKTFVKYHVAYKGVVDAGIDFDKVKIIVNEKNVEIILPKTEIFNVDVDIAKMKYIFEDDKYNTETVSSEAYKACVNDLKNEATLDKELHRAAMENTKESIEALFKPWLEPFGYTVVIKEGGTK